MLITCLSLGSSLVSQQCLMSIYHFRYCITFLQPLSISKTILIDADTVKFYASFIDSSATINDFTIVFGAGVASEELLRVPIAAPEELDPQAMLRITVGMNPPVADNDPAVGITDGVNRNQFALVEDGASTGNLNPCEVIGGTHNGRRAPHGNPVAGTYVMLYDPVHRFGTCSTNNGFATAGRFNANVDPTKGLSLVVNRDGSPEQYTFHYFLVEFL